LPISPKPFATPPWKAFAEDPAAELRDAFRVLDESPDAVAPDKRGCRRRGSCLARPAVKIIVVDTNTFISAGWRVNAHARRVFAAVARR